MLKINIYVYVYVYMHVYICICLNSVSLLIQNPNLTGHSVFYLVTVVLKLSVKTFSLGAKY